MSTLSRVWQRLLLYEQSKLIVPVNFSTAKNHLAIQLCQDFISDPAWYEARRYKGHLANDTLYLKGPFANRRWCLRTIVKLHPQGTQTCLQLTFRICTPQILALIAVFSFYATVMLSWGFGFIVAFQLAFLYLAVLIGFFYEVSQIKKLLSEAVLNNCSDQ